MKCDHCGNAMKWTGSMISGKLECEHCVNDDGLKTVKLCDGYDASQQLPVVNNPGNPLTCGNDCSMQGGDKYCDCYGEPSC